MSTEKQTTENQTTEKQTTENQTTEKQTTENQTIPNNIDKVNVYKEIEYNIQSKYIIKTPDRPTVPVPPNAPKIKRRTKLFGYEYMCEVCGIREAKVNLDLTYGSHRECRSCWDD
jgi:hypothetical protein